MRSSLILSMTPSSWRSGLSSRASFPSSSTIRTMTLPHDILRIMISASRWIRILLHSCSSKLRFPRSLSRSPVFCFLLCFLFFVFCFFGSLPFFSVSVSLVCWRCFAPVHEIHLFPFILLSFLFLSLYCWFLVSSLLCSSLVLLRWFPFQLIHSASVNLFTWPVNHWRNTDPAAHSFPRFYSTKASLSSSLWAPRLRRTPSLSSKPENWTNYDDDEKEQQEVVFSFLGSPFSCSFHHPCLLFSLVHFFSSFPVFLSFTFFFQFLFIWFEPLWFNYEGAFWVAHLLNLPSHVCLPNSHSRLSFVWCAVVLLFCCCCDSDLFCSPILSSSSHFPLLLDFLLSDCLISFCGPVCLFLSFVVFFFVVFF